MSFQRARRPEQMAARRAAILEVAREMLVEKAVADISLRELSDRVGLAKSNVLRYFDSREAIFLEVLDEEFTAWLNDVDARLGRPRTRKTGICQRDSGRDRARRLAGGTATTVRAVRFNGGCAGAQLSLVFARDFKARAMTKIGALAQLVARHLPWLQPAIHRVLRRGRADPDGGHVSVLGAHRTRAGCDGRDRPIPIRPNGSARICVPGW